MVTLHLHPLVLALVLIYMVSGTFLFGVFFVERLGARREARQPKATGPEFDRDGDVLAVGQQALDEAPELADDGEAVGRTVALTDAAMDGTLRLVPADPPGSTLERIRVERLLIEIGREIERYRHGQDITQGAPKEQP